MENIDALLRENGENLLPPLIHLLVGPAIYKAFKGLTPEQAVDQSNEIAKVLFPKLVAILQPEGFELRSLCLTEIVVYIYGEAMVETVR